MAPTASAHHARSASGVRSFAVKHCLNAHLAPAQRAAQRREAEFHSRCSGWMPELAQPVLDCVNPFIEACMAARDGDGWFLITEFFANGDLFSKLPEAPHAMPEVDASRLLLQLLAAVAGCHERGVYHRDLKPENILVAFEDEAPHSPATMHLRLTDFGMATDRRVARERGCGSVIYMAPETLRAMNTPASAPAPVLDAAKQDAWSCAQLAVNLFLSVNAWHLADAAQDKCYAFFLKNPAQNLMRFLRVSAEFNDVLVRAFEADIEKRCTVEELWRDIHDLVTRGVRFTVDEREFEARKQWMRELERASKQHAAAAAAAAVVVVAKKPVAAPVDDEAGNDSGVECTGEDDSNAGSPRRAAHQRATDNAQQRLKCCTSSPTRARAPPAPPSAVDPCRPPPFLRHRLEILFYLAGPRVLALAACRPHTPPAPRLTRRRARAAGRPPLPLTSPPAPLTCALARVIESPLAICPRPLPAVSTACR